MIKCWTGNKEKIFILGAGSNILVKDQGFDGIVIKLGKNFNKIRPLKQNPLMGWESSSDTLGELKLEFSSKELAINYAKKKKIDFELIEPKKRKTVKKSHMQIIF